MKSKLFLGMIKIRKPRNRYSKFPGVLIDANGITVTNLETTVTYRAYSALNPFTFDVDDGKVETLAKSSKEILFTTIAPDGKVRISGDEISVTIPPDSLEDYPPIPGPASRPNVFTVFEMPWAEFCEKGMRAAKFADDNAFRRALAGIYFDFPGENKAGSFVATDGKRLAILKGPETDREFKCIVPKEFFKAFYSITKIEKPETVRILAVEKSSSIWIEAGNFLFNQLLIEGQFPDYRRVFPSSEAVMTTTIGPAQKSIIDKAGKFGDEGHGLEIFRNKLVVKDVEFPQVFEFEGTMEFSPMFNAGFLSDFTDEDFDVEIFGHERPMMLHAEDACYLVMPIVKEQNKPKYRLFETGELPEPEPEPEPEPKTAEETPVENPA